MIFVTVGTHEQPFNRLIQKVDELKRDGVIKDDVIIQTGFSTYKTKYNNLVNVLLVVLVIEVIISALYNNVISKNYL